MNIASRTKLPIESSFLRFAPASNVAASAGAACTRVQSTTCMAVALAASLMPAFASSSPRVLEEVAKIELPDPSYRGGSRVAVQGDDLIVAGHKRGFDPEVGDLLIQAAFLFKRQADSNWAFVTRLAEQTDSINFGEWSDISAAIDGDVMAVAIGPRAVSLHVFERTPAGWAIAPTARPLFFDTSDVEISNGTILVSDCCWSAAVVRKNELGVWARSAGVSGGFPIPPDDDNKGGDVDISGDAFIVANHKVDLFDFPGGPEARIYERTADAWLERARLTGFGNHPDDAVGAVAIDASTAYVGGSAVTGLRVFDRSGTGEWLPTTTIAPPDTYMIGKPLRVEAEGYVAVAYPADPNRRGSVGVFQRQRSGEYEEIARLVRSDAVASSAPIDDVDIDVGPERTTLVVGTAGAAYVYELDDTTQPELVQDRFQDGDANGWSPSNVSAWGVATSGPSRVYRQKTFANEARTVLNNAMWTNQSAQADVTPTAVQGADRFAGVVVRFVDPSNYYYVSLRSSNTVQLRKKVNGTFVTLASAPFTFQLNRRYRLHVEAIGSRIRASVNGASIIEAVDRSHAEGRAGLLTWGARADFDNVVVTPNPQRTLFGDTFSNSDTSRWTKEFGDWLDPPEPVDEGQPDPSAHLRNFEQRSTTDKGRAVAGIGTDDMFVQARARATSALVAGGWFGVMARHVDDRNFYYLRLGDGRASIRKFVNGSFFELAGKPLAVNTNVVYTLRLEAVGRSLRGYVNGQFLLEASDATHAAGRYGLATNRTAVRFDNVRVQQP